MDGILFTNAGHALCLILMFSSSGVRMSPAKETRRKKAKALLEDFWGNVFNFNNPKPLKIGIDEDLAKSAEAQGLPFDEAVIKRALGA